jgi:chromosome segregation ATPase
MMIDLRDLERRHQVLDAVEQRLQANQRKLQSTQRELEDARKNIIELAPPKLPNDTEKCRVIRAAVSALAHPKREMF